MPSDQIPASVDIQFHAQGAGYVYPNGNTTLEQKKLGTLLRVCADIGKIFNVLLPTDKRAWWKEEDKNHLMLTVTDGKIPISEIKTRLQVKLDKMPVTNKMLLDAETDLPESITLNEDPTNKRYPPRVPNDAPPAEKAMGFSVEAPLSGGRIYYGKPDGTIICCTLLNLTDDFDNKAVMLKDKTVPDGRIDVIVAVHFEIPPTT